MLAGTEVGLYIETPNPNTCRKWSPPMLLIEIEPRGVYVAHHKDEDDRYLAYAVDSHGCRIAERPFTTAAERDRVISELWMALNLSDPVKASHDGPTKVYVLPMPRRTPVRPLARVSTT